MAIITPDLSRQYEGALRPEDEQPVEAPESVAQQPSQASATEDSPEVIALRQRFNIGPPSVGSKPIATTATQKKPQPSSSSTRWHQAGTAPQAKEPEMGWGETLVGAGKNLLPSAAGAVNSIYQAVRHPVDTASALGQVGSGAMSQLAGAMGVSQDPAEKAKKESLINALEEHYKQTYGSMEGFKRAFAKDPAGIIMDASTLLGGFGGGVKLAGLTGNAAKLGASASKAAVMIDPISQSINLAKKISSVPIAAMRGSAAGASGVSKYLQEVAAAAGATKDPVLRDAYKRFNSGVGDPAEYLQAAQNAVRELKATASAEYLAKKGSLNGNVNLNPVLDHLNDADKALGMGSSSGWDEAKHAASKVRELVEDLATHPSNAKRSLEEIDALKQQIWDLKSKYGPRSKAQSIIDGAYASVRDTLGNKTFGGDPEYLRLMEQYQTARNQINDAVSQLGAGNNASATNSMLRTLRKTKSASGQNMLEEISKYEPTIPYMLAGQATNPKSGGLGRYASDMGVAALAGYAVHPLAASVPLLAGSPRIVGALNYGAGKVAGTASRAAAKIPQKTAYYAGRANQEMAQPSDEAPSTDVPEASPQSETGYNVGNIRDKAGGFRSYETPEAAAAAVAKNLRSYPDRFNGGKPMTLREIANLWAPSEDNNDPDAWARNVALTAGVDPDQPIDQNDTSLMQRIIKGVHVAEHGQKKLYPDEVYARAAGPSASASGGRIERASGGKVGNAKHERIVNKLMAMASKAKKATDRTTESLLDEPDESIVKALNVAQQAI
jgi:polyhydroxyalkanoate synthesis regulator phasin